MTEEERGWNVLQLVKSVQRRDMRAWRFNRRGHSGLARGESHLPTVRLGPTMEVCTARLSGPGNDYA